MSKKESLTSHYSSMGISLSPTDNYLDSGDKMTMDIPVHNNRNNLNAGGRDGTIVKRLKNERYHGQLAERNNTREGPNDEQRT